MIAAFAAPAAPAALSPTLVSLRGTKGRQSNFINYLDANHLYGLAMSMKLPIGKLKWIKKILFRVVTKHANLKTYQKNLTAIWGLCRRKGVLTSSIEIGRGAFVRFGAWMLVPLHGAVAECRFRVPLPDVCELLEAGCWCCCGVSLQGAAARCLCWRALWDLIPRELVL